MKSSGNTIFYSEEIATPKCLMVKLFTQFWSSVVRRNSLGYISLAFSPRRENKESFSPFVKPSIGNLHSLKHFSPDGNPIHIPMELAEATVFSSPAIADS